MSALTLSLRVPAQLYTATALQHLHNNAATCLCTGTTATATPRCRRSRRLHSTRLSLFNATGGRAFSSTASHGWRKWMNLM
eukprot:362744-Chlamydomonas_euryale.AAC.3